MTSIIGQGLQIFSSRKTIGVTASERSAILLFAVPNLIANGINMAFGGQEKNDPHQLRQLKNEVNAKLAPYVEANALPDSNDTALSHRPAKHETLGQSSSRLLKKYSVSFGEIGLRTIASVNLAFPMLHWKQAAQSFIAADTLGTRFKNLYTTAKCDNKETFLVGLTMLTGKFVSFLSKEPDPYNPKPASALDSFREKVTFRLSSVIEGGAATYMAYDRFKNKKIEIGGKKMPDYYGGVGNIVFVGGYGVRLFAPYGTREVNMPELYAHIGDALAKVPDAQRPALLVQTASDLYEHFKFLPENKNHTYSLSSIYAALEKELVQYHGAVKSVAPTLRISAERELEHTLSVPATAPCL